MPWPRCVTMNRTQDALLNEVGVGKVGRTLQIDTRILKALCQHMDHTSAGLARLCIVLRALKAIESCCYASIADWWRDGRCGSRGNRHYIWKGLVTESIDCNFACKLTLWRVNRASCANFKFPYTSIA